MKILYLSTPNFADCDFPLVRAFQEKGADVTYLIVLSPWFLRSSLIDIKQQLPQTKILPAMAYQELRYLESYMDMDKVYISNRTGKSRLTVSYWKSIWNIRRFIKQGRFDVIHYSGHRGNRWCYKLAPLITTFHDPFPHTGEGYKNMSKNYERAIKRSKGIVLLNSAQLEDFCGCYSISPKKVLVNRLGVYDNIQYFVKPTTKPIKNNLLFFGRISPYKGLEYLCEAMKLVQEEIPDVTLTIAGKGEVNFDIEPYMQLGCIKIINEYISMPELAELLSLCELSVCPYTDATQSGVLMTCFALRKPVVASAVGGFCEAIENGKSGVLVPPKNVKALADAIISLLNDDEKKQKMSDYIHDEYFNGEKSWPTIADRYLKYYSDVIDNRINE